MSANVSNAGNRCHFSESRHCSKNLRPALALVVPQLTEALLEQVRRVQSLVGGQQLLERGATIEAQILAVQSFADVREPRRQLKAQRLTLAVEADEATSGPAHFLVINPDGNPVLVDQQRWPAQRGDELRPRAATWRGSLRSPIAPAIRDAVAAPLARQPPAG